MPGFDRKSRRNYSTLTKYPRPKVENRLKSPPIPKRPVRFQLRSLIDTDFLRPNDWKFILHRRGTPGRPWVGLNELELRAWQNIRGTLPERIIYKYLVDVMRFIAEVDFEFQSCVASNHKVLTADLRWVDAGSLIPGDELLSFTEQGDPMRKWTRGTVIFNKVEDMDSMKVRLSNGQEIITTPNHPWLIHYASEKRDWGKTTGYSWVETQYLKVGAYIPIFMDTWEPDGSYEAGWVAGFFDGEGAVVHGKTSTGGHSLSITIGQNKSIMLDKFNEYVEHLGFEFTNYDYTDQHHRSYDDGWRKSVNCRLAGGRAECLRFLGSIRPAKLQYLKHEKLGKLTKIRQVQVVSVEPVGKVPIARLEVDKHTYVVEGFGMHNSLQGGRLDTGGIVADFLFPYLKVVINPLGPTHGEYWRFRKDEEQISALEEMGYQVYMIEEADVYDEQKLEWWMRRIFGWVHNGAMDNVQSFEPGTLSATELDSVMDRILNLQSYLRSI